MADNNPIKYSDLVQPDNSLNDLIGSLKEIKSLLTELGSGVKICAQSVSTGMKSASGATEEGRQSIQKATSDTEQLTRAQKALQAAESSVAMETAKVESSLRGARNENKLTADYAIAAADSYTKLRAELKLAVNDLHNMSTEQALNSQSGQDMIARIVALKEQIKEFDDNLAIQTVRQHAATAAQQENNAASSEQLQITARISAAKERLSQVMSNQNQELMQYNMQIRQANTMSRLETTIATEKEGSYNQLSAQYSLNKIKLNQMSAEERGATASGKQLETETNDLYQRMIKLQEATGNHRLSVGNYARAWNGLGMSVNQIIRELPSAAISVNTFFLAISNNIPILVDEINRLKIANKAAMEEGRPTTSVIGGITKALFSWNTVLVLLLTAFSMYGKQIIDFITTTITGAAAIGNVKKEVQDLNTEIGKDTTYGAQIATVRRLSNEWKELGSNLKDEKQWIRDNKTEFDQLDISINKVSDAENIFSAHTGAMTQALMLRAKATAALNLASQSYQKMITMQNTDELERQQGMPWYKNLIYQIGSRFEAIKNNMKDEDLLDPNGAATIFRAIFHMISPSHKDKRDAARMMHNLFGGTPGQLRKQGDDYIKMYEKFQDQINDIYKQYGFDNAHKNVPKTKKPKQLIDPSMTINQEVVKEQKDYAQTLTSLEKDELVKRRKTAIDTYNDETNALQIQYIKNQRILDNYHHKYMQLSKEERQELTNTQNVITENIKAKRLKLLSDLNDVQQDEAIRSNKIAIEDANNELKTVEKNSDAEMALKLKVIGLNSKVALAENAKKPKAEQQNPEDIINAGVMEGAYTRGEYAEQAFKDQQTIDANIFEEVEHNENKVKDFKLKQQRALIKEQLNLAQLGQKNMSSKEIEAAQDQIKDLDQQIKKNDQGKTLLERVFPNITDDQEKATDTYFSNIESSIQGIISSEIQLAQQSVKTAQQQVESAQKVYEAEETARANGYANNAAAAKKELNDYKKKEEEKAKLLEKYQKAQIALDTATQTSSLITASANIWASFSKLGPIGVGLAVAAIATMWGSFIAAKVKANQVTKEETQTYGEGGLEFLDGGSHASGHDIDMGHTKSGRNRRAEGGEAMAIFNRRNTSKYREVLPDIVKSINKGTFEQRYMNSFDAGNKLVTYSVTSATDTRKMERILSEIKTQGDIKYVQLGNGTVLEINGKNRRIIKS